jgi:ATP-dependent DNA helicase RecG
MAEGVATTLATPLRAVAGIGPRRAADLEGAGLRTVGDFLTRFPLRYEDRGRVTPIAAVAPDTPVSLTGTVARCGLRPTRRPGYTLFELLLRDDTGTISALWFNQRFLRDVFGSGDRVTLYGRVERTDRGGLQVVNPQYEILARRDDGAGPGEPDVVHTGRIVPVYERIGSLTPKLQRSLVHRLLAALPPDQDDPLPPSVQARMGLPGLGAALREVHFPAPGADLESLQRFRSPAHVRLVFDEFFAFQAGLRLRRRALARERKPHVVAVDDRVRAAARAVLPFPLTAGQRDALREIVADLQRPAPMNRLLQGDVGAGKTIVAALSAVVALENGLQVALMAPTEILAEQHVRTLTRLLAATRHRVRLLTGSTPARERRGIERGLRAGHAGLVVGTHALVQESVGFRRLGLAIVDEQHRFGVVQRGALRDKGLCPDVLVMTATPIPRTLSLTLYGDLDVSVIRDLPPGRTPITTTARPESRREQVYALMREVLGAGRQVYVIYPVVDESAKIDVRAATAMADHLATTVFPEYRVGLLHGRLPADAKDRVMTAFARGEVDVLVATTVVEVGVDVPNATLMVVEHAERFGLAQLHQLRGRVGRGPHASYCVLLYQPPLRDEARERLRVLADSTDGFVIAEKDLALRGPGDFFGTRQAGRPMLRVGDPIRDLEIMERAREQAVAWLDEAGEADGYLAQVRATWAERFGLLGVG